MYLSNLETVPGRKIIEFYGLVAGNTVRSKDIAQDIGATIKNFVGGELKAYTALMQEARAEAVERLSAQAKQLGANAVVNIRFETSAITKGAAELYVYGTAVKVAE